MDCFGGTQSWKDQLICFLMHNIPAYILMLVLFIAWRWELAGGILFIVAAVAGALFFRAFNGNPGVLIVMLPFLITGVLFILHHEMYG